MMTFATYHEFDEQPVKNVRNVRDGTFIGQSFDQTQILIKDSSSVSSKMA
jgi:hypothetical protein